MKGEYGIRVVRINEIKIFSVPKTKFIFNIGSKEQSIKNLKQFMPITTNVVSSNPAQARCT
jgi:hypothetical protein